MNHAPWERGSITDMFAPFGLTQKTIKTVCGKRVKTNDADSHAIVECAECARILVEEQQQQLARINAYAVEVLNKIR